MNDRIIAILNEKKNNVENVKLIISDLERYGVKEDGTKIVIFTKEVEKYASADYDIIQIPENCDTRPKMKNFVTRRFKENGFTGFLHVIEDRIALNDSPRQFILDIENMMNVFDLNCWFDTVTDTCNYLYSKYNPRLDIMIDNPDYVKLFNISNAIFCSHSNVQWVIYNMKNADDDELYFCEEFKIDMFFIIEFLARRKNSHPDSLYFMNQYFTCKSEKGLFKIRTDLINEQDEDLSEQMKKEDSIFRSKNVNYAPDNNIDRVLELLYKKMKLKSELNLHQ